MAFLDMFRQKRQTVQEKKTTPQEEPRTEEASYRETPKIRVVFMGTPAFAASMLEGLITKEYNIVGVVTKPDKPVGRKKEIEQSAVKTLALAHDLPIEQPGKLDEAAIEKVRAWKPDLIVVAAYGKILPEELLKIPGFGCINVHASLLPRWRGASPIHNALLSGDTTTGITIMQMDEGMDTGDILAQKGIEIFPTEMREDLTARLVHIGRELLLETIPLWVERRITPQQQENDGATLCQLIERQDGRIVWTNDAEEIYNRYRALSPWPGIFTFWKKDDDLLRLKLHQISYQKQTPETHYRTGEVFELGEKIGVQSGSGVILLEEIQLEGKDKMSVAEFMRGNAGFIGSLLQ